MQKRHRFNWNIHMKFLFFRQSEGNDHQLEEVSGTLHWLTPTVWPRIVGVAKPVFFWEWIRLSLKFWLYSHRWRWVFDEMVETLPGSLHPMPGFEAWLSFWFQLPANGHARRQKVMAQVLCPCYVHKTLALNFWFLASFWLNPRCWKHLRNEPGNRSSVSLPSK